MTAKPLVKKDIDRAPNTISQFLSPFLESGPVGRAREEVAIGSIFGLAREGDGAGALTGAINGDSTANEAWAARLAHRSAAAQPVPLQIPPATAKPLLAKHDRASARQQMQREDEEEEEKRDLLMIQRPEGEGNAQYSESIDAMMRIPNTSPSLIRPQQDVHVGASSSSSNEIDSKRPSISDMIGLSEPQLSSASSSMLYSPDVVGRRGVGDDERLAPSLDSGGPILVSNEGARSVSLHLVGSAGVGVSLGSGGKVTGGDVIDNIHRFSMANNDTVSPVDLSVPLQGKRLRRFAPGDGDVPPRPCWEKSHHVATTTSPFGFGASFSSIAKLEGKVLLTSSEHIIGEPSLFAVSAGPSVVSSSPSDPSALARSGLDHCIKDEEPTEGFLNVSEL